MAGIYIHIPFCKQKCTYCDFHFSTSFEKHRNQMVDAIISELKERVNYLEGQPVQTIYFGGGTPSLLTKKEIKRIINTIYQEYTVQEEIEFTLEANPDDINKAQLESWKKSGISRLSIGLQSFHQEDLDWMNRAHTADESESAVILAKEYGFSLTVDLIYGIPNRTTADWLYNINKLVELQPEHISAYCLTVEKRTALHQLIKKGELPEVGEDEQSEQFMLLVNTLKNAGYQQYEISNFAKDEQYSVHNSNYWKGVHYLGVGPSAHSFNGTSRRWNVSNNPRYIKGVSGDQKYYEKEELSAKDQFNELLLTGLRTKWGVSLDDLFSKFQPTPSFHKQLELFKQHQLISEEKDIIMLTEKGKLQADHIASQLFTE